MQFLYPLEDLFTGRGQALKKWIIGCDTLMDQVNALLFHI